MPENQESPTVKSIRLTASRLSDSIANRLIRENDVLKAVKLSGALTEVGMALTLVGSDYVRANRMLAKARQLANSTRGKDDEEF